LTAAKRYADIDSISTLHVDRRHVREFLIENDQGPVKVEDNGGANVHVAVKLNVGVDVEVIVQVEDPSYPPDLLVL
jgi:hypothetical protein